MSADVPLAGWAVVLPPGARHDRRPGIVVEIGEHVTEKWIWSVALGWPTEGEVAEAKMRGARAFRCRLVAEDAPT